MIFFTNSKIFITMILDVDFLIDFFKKHSTEGTRGEMGEQDAPATPAPSSGGSGKAPPKWADSYPLKRDKANRLGLAGEKWETGLTRGAANQIW
jgi:hypothetical protein